MSDRNTRKRTPRQRGALERADRRANLHPTEWGVHAKNSHRCQPVGTGRCKSPPGIPAELRRRVATANERRGSSAIRLHVSEPPSHALRFRPVSFSG